MYSIADSITLMHAGNSRSASPCSLHCIVMWVEAKHRSHLVIANAFPVKHMVYINSVAFMRDHCLLPVIMACLQNPEL